MKRLVIIPAKSKSIRIRKKNFVLINNMPIYKYTLNNVLKSKLFNKVHISSDKLINKKYQEFLRPPSLCKDKTSLNEVIHWTLLKYKERGLIFNSVCLAYPTSPMLEAIDFKKACAKFEKNKNFPLISVSKFNPSIDEAMIKRGKFVRPRNIKKFYKDSKKHKEYFFDTGSFVFFNTKKFYKKNILSDNLSQLFIPFVISRIKSVDINTKEDLNFLKQIIKIK